MINNKESDDDSVKDSEIVHEESEEERKVDNEEKSNRSEEVQSVEERSEYCMLSVVIIECIIVSRPSSYLP